MTTILEHPDITAALRTGYPIPVSAPKYYPFWGGDYDELIDDDFNEDDEDVYW